MCDEREISVFLGQEEGESPVSRVTRIYSRMIKIFSALSGVSCMGTHVLEYFFFTLIYFGCGQSVCHRSCVEIRGQ